MSVGTKNKTINNTTNLPGIRGGKKTMKREQIFNTAHEAFIILNNYTKHGWHGYVEKCGDKFKLIICC